MNDVEGTRQNHSVTSGEGGLARKGEWYGKVSGDCLSKTQDFANL